MSANPTPTHPDRDPGQQAEDAQLYRCVLHELIHIGTDLARLLHQQAVAHAQAAVQGRASFEPPSDHTVAFDRVARAIRRSITLARSIAQPAAPAHTPAQPRTAARLTPHDAADATSRPPPPPATPEGDGAQPPNAGLRDRPEAPDRDDDVTTRPVAEVIAEIRRDLGLATPPAAHPWQRRIPADTKQLCARVAAPSNTRQPGAGPVPTRTIFHPAPNPVRPNPPPTNLATPRAPPRGLPDAPAEAVATILRHPARIRWRPPSDD